MEALVSRDGTRIAFERSGDGAPLVLVHGGISDHSYWEPVRAALAERFSLYAIERRGRGQSGDTDPYAIEREFEDVAALLASIDEPSHLLGHSYGAICALEGALLAENVATLVLYEPPLDRDGFGFPPGLVEQLETRLADGDRDGVVATMMTDVVGLTADELGQLRNSASWEALVATANTLPRELRSVARYRFDPERFRRLNLPAVLLAGEESPDSLLVGISLLNETLPRSRVVTMAGVGHEAVETGPAIFTSAVLEILEAQPSRPT
jgi:pimeloyl-ACP methyl ester carboxylesterase